VAVSTVGLPPEEGRRDVDVNPAAERGLATPGSHGPPSLLAALAQRVHALDMGDVCFHGLVSGPARRTGGSRVGGRPCQPPMSRAACRRLAWGSVAVLFLKDIGAPILSANPGIKWVNSSAT
jgi:hypothetical protein